MSNKNLAIKVESISKIYRIGLKESIKENFASVIFNFLKSPLKNYKRYRSLYKFNDIDFSDAGAGNDPSDIVWALRDVSFEVKHGEVLGIIGRNGAGKSTLLKILTKVTDPTRGRAEIRGRVSSLLEVGTGFHQELTGRENIYLNGTILGMTKKEIDRKLDQIVDFSGVERFINTPVKRYSSGMTVRLAFSVAAFLEPEVLLIDEVLAVGDADFQKKCLNKMEEVGKAGRTVIFVSHNMPAVTRLCDRVILLEDGRLVKDGPTHQVIKSYLNSNLGTTAAREWRDPATAPSSDIARLIAARVRDEGGRVAEIVKIQRPFKVEMEYEVLKEGLVLYPLFSFENEEGQCAFLTLDQDPAWRRRPRTKGRYVSTVHIPGNLLNEGMIFVSCVLLTMNPDHMEFGVDAAVAFHVVDDFTGNSSRGDYSKKMKGLVRPLLKWATQHYPAADKVSAIYNDRRA
jgi:homopolymeric O-antigen transport system ATP-binding protein